MDSPTVVITACVRPQHITTNSGGIYGRTLDRTNEFTTEVEFEGYPIRGGIEVQGGWPGLMDNGDPFNQEFIITITKVVPPERQPKLDLAGNPIAP